MRKSQRRRLRPEAPGPAPAAMELRAGPAPSVTDAAGREWRLGWNTQDAKAELEALVLSHETREAVRRMRAVGGEEGLADYEMFQNRVSAGAYHTFGVGWVAVMGGADASWLFLLSLLRRNQPGATPADAKRLLAEEPEQVRVAVGAVAPDFFEAAARQVGVERDATPERVRAAAETIAAAVLERFPAPPAPATC